MAYLLLSSRRVGLALVAAAVAAACGGGASNQVAAAAGSGGASSSTSSSSSSSSEAASSSSSSGCATGGSGVTTLTFPQLVHGAAYVDTTLDPALPVVVAATGTKPDTVEVTVDGTPFSASLTADGWLANVTTSLTPGAHKLEATAKVGCNKTATANGSLVAGTTSLQFTQIAKDGIASNGHVMHDVPGDALVYTWVSDPTGAKHQLSLNRLDGAFARLLPADVAINDPNDEPLSGYTALSANGIGVVYRTPKPNDPHWLVKMRVVDGTGNELVPVMDLTQGDAAFSMQAAGADPNGFSGAWLHISPALDGGTSPPLEVRFARYNLTTKSLEGPIVLDSDQPPAPSDPEDEPQAIEPLAEMRVACNDQVCVVAYVRDVFNATAATVEPKVFAATVSLSSFQLVGPPVLVGGAQNFNFQMSGNDVIALADGTFVLVYQETLILPPPCSSPMYGSGDTCCMSGDESSDAFFAIKLDATGTVTGSAVQVYAFEGQREYPRIAEHPAGLAFFWEDQRSECSPSAGYIRMAPNLVGANLVGLLDPYVELPGSIALPGEDPTLAVLGTNFVVSWSDNRNGNGLLQDEDEQYLDTYWRK